MNLHHPIIFLTLGESSVTLMLRERRVSASAETRHWFSQSQTLQIQVLGPTIMAEVEEGQGVKPMFTFHVPELRLACTHEPVIIVAIREINEGSFLLLSRIGAYWNGQF